MVSETFDNCLIENNVRGVFVEYLIAEILGEGWTVSSTWDSWDLNGPCGAKVEVKSSSFLQSWHKADEFTNGKALPKPTFDIAARTGRWEGNDWIAEPGRAASVYIFAIHTETNFELADQRKLSQWEFYVATAKSLPVQKSISLSRLQKLFKKKTSDQLPEFVAFTLRQMKAT